MEYLVSQYDEDPSSQPLLDLEGWLRATGEVSRHQVIECDHNFNPPAARYSSQGLTIQTRTDAHVQEVVQKLWSQRPQSFQDAICDTIIEILRYSHLYD